MVIHILNGNMAKKYGVISKVGTLTLSQIINLIEMMICWLGYVT